MSIMAFAHIFMDPTLFLFFFTEADLRLLVLQRRSDEAWTVTFDTGSETWTEKENTGI